MNEAFGQETSFAHVGRTQVISLIIVKKGQTQFLQYNGGVCNFLAKVVFDKKLVLTGIQTVTF